MTPVSMITTPPTRVGDTRTPDNILDPLELKMNQAIFREYINLDDLLEDYLETLETNDTATIEIVECINTIEKLEKMAYKIKIKNEANKCKDEEI